MCSREALDQLLLKLYAQLEGLFGEHLKTVVLFGSYARGDAGEGSDVDVLVLVDLPRREIVNYRRSVASIAGEYLFSDGLLLSLLLENETFFEQNCRILPFYQNIVREGRTFGREVRKNPHKSIL